MQINKYYCLLICLIVFPQIAFTQSSKIKSETSSSDYIGFYQKYISGIRGQECPMYPSCSNYALTAFKENNFVTALVLSTDRLVRCGHELNESYDLTMTPNGFKYLDYPAPDNSPKKLLYVGNKYYYAFVNKQSNVDSSLLFVKSLINNGYYQQALLEVKRIEFAGIFKPEIFTNELICLKAMGEYEKAIFEYEISCPVAYKKEPEILYELAAINYKLNNYGKAISLLDTAINHTHDPDFETKALVFKGVLYANKYDWKNAERSYNDLSGLPFDAAKREENIRLLRSTQSLPHKNVVAAGILSIVPGAGYAYIGHRQTAISSFLLNGVLAYATYGNIRNHNYGMAALTGIFSTSFYIANIYGALQSARRYNEQQKKNIINKLEYKSNLNL